MKFLRTCGEHMAESMLWGNNHLRVNHSLNFVDPITDANIQQVEKLANKRDKKQNGTH